MRSICFVIMTLSCVGCRDDAVNQLVLAIDTDLAVPNETAALSVQLQGPSGASELLVAPLQGDDAKNLPLTLGLVTSFGAATPVGVKVCARGGSADALCISQQTTFQSDTRLWYVNIDRACSAVCCDAGQTCSAGRCLQPLIPGATLPTWTGEVPSRRLPTVCDRGGGELCNGIDDDCDGVIDEGFDLSSDNDHCGACGRRCGSNECTNGACGSDTVASIAVGKGHACAVRAESFVSCWGSNGSGQLGDGTRLSSDAAVLVSGVNDVQQVVAGAAFSCARSGGRAVCWGDDTQGQLGDGEGVAEAVTDVRGLTEVDQLSAGAEHACASQNGRVHCWGSNRSAQLSSACASSRCTAPVEVPLTGEARWVSAGGQHSCAAMSDGRVWCWGANADLQLGSSDPQASGPLEVTVPSGAVGVVAGRNHSCAWTAAGAVWCWGGNEHGQLGSMAAKLQDSAMPQRVESLSATSMLESSKVDTSYSCAVDAGKVRCWGENAAGQLGAGAGQDSVSPSSIAAINGAQGIAAGAQQACAFDASSQVWCWGKASSTSNGLPAVVRCVF